MAHNESLTKVRQAHTVPLPARQSISFTVDLEDHLNGARPARYPANTRRMLAFFTVHGIAATFFVDASLASEAPALLREVAAAGHEIGCHSFRHRPLTQEEPAAFAAGLASGRARLQDATGQPVLGFRAPEFSLTPATSWAVEAIGVAGFAYSSSVLPGRGFLYGHPAAPRRPFFWPNGVLELPCPVGKVGPISLPFLGGTYLRYLPPWRLRWLSRQLGGQMLWTYCHPFDFDPDEPFGLVPGLGVARSLLFLLNRRVLVRRWAAMAAAAGPPLGERLAEFRVSGSERLARLAVGEADVEGASSERPCSFAKPRAR